MQIPSRLPFRIAHPTHPELSYFTEEYFEMLVRCGYRGLYLDQSPFDHDTGNVAQFFKDFHLISFYDIAYSHDRDRIRDYYHEAAERASRYDLKIYMQAYEPRLPYYAWGSTPPHWRGHGGWPHPGNDAIAYCWSEPDAVAYWKQMAHDALAALPEIRGISISFMDNEAVPCDERCPKCKGKKVTQMMCDVLGTFAEIGKTRDEFEIFVIDWWMTPERIAELRGVLGENPFVIGHSCMGLTQEIDGEPVPGANADMTMIVGRNSEEFTRKQREFTAQGFRFIDRPAWSHASENWYLPAPPDPAFAIEKLNSLVASGAEGWWDYDCGGAELGSLSDAIAAWTKRPDAEPAELVAEVLQGIFGEQWERAREAYDLYSQGKNYFPVAYDNSEVFTFSARSLALSTTMAAPFFLEDFVYFDTLHAFNWFAPFNLVTPSTICYVTPRVSHAVELIGQAHEAIQQLDINSPAAARERDAFEIHYRQYRSIANYFRLAGAKLLWLNQGLTDEVFEQRVRAIAQDELENHVGIGTWLSRNPGELDNPCHYFLGRLEESWPGIDFQTDMLAPKRSSLEKLLDYKITPPLPRHLRV